LHEGLAKISALAGMTPLNLKRFFQQPADVLLTERIPYSSNLYNCLNPVEFVEKGKGGA
jgi:hypothetical protein